MIGSIVDKYEVLRKIGEGGMATVYHARHVTLDRDVALKVMHPHLSNSLRNRDRFAREAKTIERLNHDSILKILDYSGSEKNDCYIVTELIDGITLKELLEQENELPSELVAIIALKLTEALCYAHSFGIIHRDLKPENVMIRRDGQIKLMDFGIARIMDDVHLTMTGNLVGSPAYMSPEQAQEKHLTPASDWFSFGTLLFHLCSGQLPFQGSNPSIVLKNIIDGEKLGFQDICPDESFNLAQLIDKLHAHHIDKRLINKDDIQSAIELVLIESDIDLSDPRWKLESWLSAPADYRKRLKQHVSEALLTQGRSAVVTNHNFEAIQYLSRLLSIDDNHEEANSLLDQMHQHNEVRPKAQVKEKDLAPFRWAGALGFVFSIVAISLLWPEAPSPVIAPIVNLPRENPKPTTLSLVEAKPTAQTLPILNQRPTLVRAQTQAIIPLEQTASTASKSLDEPSKVLVTVRGAWADIWIDGDRVGRTGDGPITVSPGTHTLRLENEFAIPHEEQFTVAPGESHSIDVTALKRKPSAIIIPNELEAECQASLDESPLGTLQALNYSITIQSPNESHRLLIQCADNTQYAKIVEPIKPGTTIPIRF